MEIGILWSDDEKPTCFASISPKQRGIAVDAIRHGMIVREVKRFSSSEASVSS